MNQEIDPIHTESEQNSYVHRVLERYRKTPTTAGYVRAADRRLARQLYQRGVSLKLVEAAFALAATRRIFRPYQAPRLNPIRSLHYFLPVIEELQKQPPDPRYIQHLEWKLRNLDRYGLSCG